MEIKTNTLRGKVASTYGVDGRDGLTPYIKNGTWWIGNEDTGVNATGAQGLQGEKGDAGYTPAYGVDYMTDADKEKIKAYIDGVIAPLQEEIDGVRDELHLIYEGGVE